MDFSRGKDFHWSFLLFWESESWFGEDEIVEDLASVFRGIGSHGERKLGGESCGGGDQRGSEAGAVG